MLKEILFGNKVRSILKSTDKILKRLAEAGREDTKEYAKLISETIIGLSGTIFTPENIDAAARVGAELMKDEEFRKQIGL